jgi:hypothetical protein
MKLNVAACKSISALAVTASIIERAGNVELAKPLRSPAFEPMSPTIPDVSVR